MLRVEVDIFSGRPNPVWIITDGDEVNELLGNIGRARGAAARPGAGFTGLGYREVRLSLIGDDEARPKGVPGDLAIGSTAAADRKATRELARRVVDGMLAHRDVTLVQHGTTPLDGRLQEYVREHLDARLEKPYRKPRPPKARPKNPLRTTVHDGKCQKCEYEASQYNPGFWNVPAVQPHNNCYIYARNWRTDTFAQPGRAHGAQTGTMQCPNVTTAAMADGLKKRCDCLPASEWPRRLMALVVAPNWDYHWYREQRGGFWGHKPGSTAARNVDNNGALVVNPQTAARGPYTQFCGYFYAGKSVVIN